MVSRKIVQINEELCNGCGQCIPKCVEGALQIVNGKDKLFRDDYCDGLGACLGHCPQDAINIIERQANPFDKKKVHVHLANKEKSVNKSRSRVDQSLKKITSETRIEKSAIKNWPVQINLLPLEAPYLNNSELLVIADCVPVAYPDLHSNLLKERTVVIGCPKFDDVQFYVEKLGEIFRRNDVKSITLAHMEVPCCYGMIHIAQEAIKRSGKDVPLKTVNIGIKGEILEQS